MEKNPKRRAAEGALPFLSGARIVGMGTGSTVMELVAIMEPDDRLYVPTSVETAQALARRGFRVTHPASVRSIDVYIDGADEVDPNLDMIKGRGGALTAEKLLANHSRTRIFVVDESKLVSRLGERGPLPVEVLPEAIGLVEGRLEEMGLRFSERSCPSKRGPLLSDTRGYLLDLEVPPGMAPRELDSKVRSIAGVVETGFFLGMADAVVVGYSDRTRVISRRPVSDGSP
ncbi:MAG: ribose 5-phosphate isomerase A [Conexivisphaera sp.]